MQIEEMEKKIDEEIIKCHEEMKGTLQEIMELECLNAGHENPSLRLKNDIKINLVSAPRQAPLPINTREEIKEAVLEKVSKYSTTNFTNDDKVCPPNFTTYIPMPPKDRVKASLIDDETN
jgi:hypothetical protein